MAAIQEAPEALINAVTVATTTREAGYDSAAAAAALERRHLRTYDSAYDLLRAISGQSLVPDGFRTEPIPTRAEETVLNLSLMSTTGWNIIPDSIPVIVDRGGKEEVLFRINSYGATRDVGGAVGADELDQVDGILRFIAEQHDLSYPVDASRIPPEPRRTMKEAFEGTPESRRRVRIIEQRLRMQSGNPSDRII